MTDKNTKKEKNNEPDEMNPDVESSTEATKKDESKKTKKNASTQSQIQQLKEEKDQLHDQLLRKIAEFENYKRRTAREFIERVQNANENLITELLPVLDDMERSIEHARNSKDAEALISGSELIYKKFLSILEKQGLEELPAVGEEFDPDKHDALMQVENEEADSGKIIDQHLKGYMLNGKVLRHSQVIVAK